MEVHNGYPWNVNNVFIIPPNNLVLTLQCEWASERSGERVSQLVSQ